MSERTQALEKYHSAPSLYAGGGVRKLGFEKLSGIAAVVSKELAARPHTMICYTSDEIIRSMYEKRAACVLNGKGELAAFAQFWPYKIDDTGDGFLRGEEVFEVGSWLSFANGQEKGWGRKVFDACVTVGRMLHPDGKFIAIIEKGNEKAADILISMGGTKIGEKNSKQVKDVYDNPGRMSIYRLGTP